MDVLILKRYSVVSWIFTLLSLKGLAQTIQPIEPSTRVVVNGDRVSLTCTVTSTTASENIGWYHNGNIITFGSMLLVHRDNAYSVDSGNFPVVDGVESSTYHWIVTINSFDSIRDMGTWSCRLGTTGNEQEQNVDLVVSAPPQVTFVTEARLNPDPGSDVTLQCNATGFPEPGITWSRSYPHPFIMMGDGSKKMFTRSTLSNTVMLTNVGAQHRGLYSCSVTNGISDPDIRQTYVQLPYAPVVTASLERVRVTEGGQAILACVSQAYPPTEFADNVIWTKDGQDVGSLINHAVEIDPHPERYYGERYFSQLVISNVNSEHTGVYTCQFSNTQGEGTATVMLGLEPAIDFNFGAKNTF